MTLAASLALGLLIGAVLGGLGGGGTILTVPVLVYILGQSAQSATTSSLVIVGITSAVGMIEHARAHRVRWRTGITFGVTGLVATWAGTRLNKQIDEHLLLLGFAVVMLVAATLMLARTRRRPTDGRRPAPEVGNAGHGDGNIAATRASTRTLTGARAAAVQEAPAPRRRSVQIAKVLAAGLGVGFLTGLFGVGGGFIIVPALTLVLGLPMTAAVGTSLLVIAVNSGTALLARTGSAHFDWAIIVPFTAAAILGTTVGKRTADHLPARALNRCLAILLIAVAIYVAVHSALSWA